MKYMGHAVWPMLVMIIPVVLILIHLDLWFVVPSLQPGETGAAQVTLQEGAQALAHGDRRRGGRVWASTTPPLRLDARRKWTGACAAMQAGLNDVTIRVGGETVTKQSRCPPRPSRGSPPVRSGPGSSARS